MVEEQTVVSFGEKQDGKEYIHRPAVYAVIVNEQQEVAVVRSRGMLLLPGGGMEKDESREECLRRECAEELGYDIEIGPFIGCAAQYLVSHLNGEPLKIIGYFYRAVLGEPNGCKSEPDHELDWLPVEEAASSMYTEFAAWAIRYESDRSFSGQNSVLAKYVGG